MDHFAYQNGVLSAEQVPLPRIAEAVGTPVYVYAAATFRRHARVFSDAVAALRHPNAPAPLVAFAVKANSNLSVLRLLAVEGLGADVVSEGEMRRALAAGIAPEKIVFSGVGKTAAEIRAALTAGIFQLNAESLPELETIAACARELGVTAPVALRINPDVTSGTHAKIATGHGEAKFGVAMTDLPACLSRIAGDRHLSLAGLAVHIGSQITKLDPFAAACEKLVALIRDLRGQGHGIRRLDLGGGLGIPYQRRSAPPPLPAAYAEALRPVLKDFDGQLIFEPGRMIAGNAGLLLTRVVRVKAGQTRPIVVLDAGMNDLIRPALYDAWHDVLPVMDPALAETGPADLVGPVCETADTFARARTMPPLPEGALVAIMGAGAYGAVQASQYNTRCQVPEVLVDGAQFALVRRRPSFDEILSQDVDPAWQPA